MGKSVIFKGKSIRYDYELHKKVCIICGKKPSDEYINYKGEKGIIELTHLHHIEYHEDDPLKDAIEICVSCHHRKSIIEAINKYYKTIPLEELRKILVKILQDEYCIRCNTLMYRKLRYPISNYDGYLCHDCFTEIGKKNKEFDYEFMTIKLKGIDSIHCHCGCNTMISVYDSRGTKRKYARGHNPEFTLRPKRTQMRNKEFIRLKQTLK